MSYFPKKISRELFGSRLGRYLDHLGIQKEKHLKMFLFGIEREVNYVLPGHIESMTSNLQIPDVCPEEVLFKHTLYPYYALALPEDRQEMLKANMLREDNPQGYILAGLTSTRIRPSLYLKYCPVCVTEDREKHGECFWHVSHQACSVLVCPHHSVWLVQSDILISKNRSGTCFTALESIIPENVEEQSIYLNPESKEDRFLHQMALLTYDVLTHDVSKLNKNTIWKKLHYLLGKSGYLKGKGSLSWLQFMQDFNQKFPPEILEIFDCKIDLTLSDPWIRRLLIRGYDSNSHHPVQYFIVFLFFEISIEDLLNLPEYHDYFGAGPWECKNPVCQEFKQRTIERFTPRFLSDGRFRGDFCCDKCQFTYGLIWQDDKEENYYWVINRGEMWNSKLLELWRHPDYRQSDIAPILEISISAVKKMVTRILQSSPREKVGRPNPGIRKRKKRDKFRQIWLEQLDIHHNATFKMLSDLNPEIVNFLMRNDITWLRANSPADLPEITKKGNELDYETIDRRISEQIIRAYRELLDDQDCPVWITKTKLVRKIHRTNLLSFIKKNPNEYIKTAKVLNECAESKYEWCIRRIWWHTHNLIESKVEVDKSRFTYLTGVRYTRDHPSVAQAFDKAFDFYQSKIYL